jgi:hypothetical protein
MSLYQERKHALLIDYSMPSLEVGTSFARSLKTLLVKRMENQYPFLKVKADFMFPTS